MFKFLLTRQQTAESGFGLIGGGILANGTLTNVTDKYTFATNSVNPGPSITAKYISATFSNKSIGVFAGGGNFTPTSTTQLFTFSSESFSTGASLIVGAVDACGFGNLSTGLCAGGTSYSRLEKYSFSGASWSVGASLSQGKWGHASTGTSARAIFAGGAATYSSPVNNVCIEYSFSGDSWTTRDSLSTARAQASGISSPTVGYFSGGSSFSVNYKSTEKFIFSTNSVSVGTNLNVTTRAPAGTENTIRGIFAAGSSTTNDGGAVATVEKYRFSDDAVASGTSLGVARAGPSATSSAPGHL